MHRLFCLNGLKEFFVCKGYINKKYDLGVEIDLDINEFKWFDNTVMIQLKNNKNHSYKIQIKNTFYMEMSLSFLLN